MSWCTSTAGPCLRHRALGLRRLPPARHAHSASITRPPSIVRTPRALAGERSIGDFHQEQRRPAKHGTRSSIGSSRTTTYVAGVVTPMHRRYHRPNSYRTRSVVQSRWGFSWQCHPLNDSGCNERGTLAGAGERTRTTRPRVVAALRPAPDLDCASHSLDSLTLDHRRFSPRAPALNQPTEKQHG